jgi:hypothetical protein
MRKLSVHIATALAAEGLILSCLRQVAMLPYGANVVARPWPFAGGSNDTLGAFK